MLGLNSTPVNTLYLWYLGNPGHPVLVGELNLVMSARGVSFKYDTHWLRNGFPLSEDLPLVDIEYHPREKDTAVGAIDDARPDRWGEKVIRFLDRPVRLSILEFLYYAGDNRFGALGVSPSGEEYQPRKSGPLPQLSDVAEVNTIIHKILMGEPLEEHAKRLIAPGVTMGGTRPKALLQLEGDEWILKFAEEAAFEPLIEHATMTLAAQAGIVTALTRPIKLHTGFAVAVKRFDRFNGSSRRHALSANVALRAAGVELGYPNLALLLRRRGVVVDQMFTRQMHELFRRLIFNILMDNTDDHEKNHVLLVTDSQHYELAPAFDVLPTGQSLGYQAMMVGQQGAESSVDNAFSMAGAYWLTPQAAVDEARKVALVVDSWHRHFAKMGLNNAVLSELVAHIDRPFLLQQRRALLQHLKK